MIDDLVRHRILRQDAEVEDEVDEDRVIDAIDVVVVVVVIQRLPVLVHLTRVHRLIVHDHRPVDLDLHDRRHAHRPVQEIADDVVIAVEVHLVRIHDDDHRHRAVLIRREVREVREVDRVLVVEIVNHQDARIRIIYLRR